VEDGEDFNVRDIAQRAMAGEVFSEAERQAFYDMAHERGWERIEREESAAPEPSKLDTEGTIYYVRTCCRIKIGFTTDLTRRMKALSPDELLATEPGTPSVERKRHDQFAEYRVRGEWFKESPALAAHIEALRRRHHTAVTDSIGERLISTASAQSWTGRSRQVLYRWAKEGRITRYGTPQEALWDVFELPVKRADGKLPDPPPKRS
jgi:hypothetical protein